MNVTLRVANRMRACRIVRQPHPAVGLGNICSDPQLPSRDAGSRSPRRSVRGVGDNYDRVNLSKKYDYPNVAATLERFGTVDVLVNNARYDLARSCINPRRTERLGHCAIQSAAGNVAVNSMPSAFITASVVFKVGLPWALNER